MNVNMELLQLIGRLRGALLEPGSRLGGTPSEILAEALARSGELPPSVHSILEELARAGDGELILSAGDSTGRGTLDRLLDAVEGAIFDPEDPRLVAGLSEAFELWRKQPSGAADPSGSASGPGADESGEGVGATVGGGPGGHAGSSLDAVAAYLVQMDPVALDALAFLRDRIAELESLWSGSEKVRAQFRDRLAELEAVVGNRRSRRNTRVATVERVGELIEAAMVEQEAAQYAGPAELESVRGPVREGAERADGDGFDGGSGQATSSGSDVSAPSGGGPAIDADPELVLDFVAEGLEYLDQAEAALLALEGDPGDSEAINVTFRAFHTIKGVSAFLDLAQVSHVAHEAETLLDRVRGGTVPFTEGAADLFFRSADVLRGLLIGIREAVDGGVPRTPEGLEPLLEMLSDPELPGRLREGGAIGKAPTSQGLEPASAPGGGGETPTGPERAGRDEAPQAGATGEDSVRIRTERLDRLVDLVGELVVSHSMISQDAEVLGSRGHLGKKVSHSQKILRELQDLSTSLRMVPLKPAFHKITRVVRDVARRSGKRVELVTTGEETELDRSMVAVITDPLVHMVRNSVDHGLESAEERAANGKPQHGTLRLTARQSGGNVVVEIEDDGRGLDRDRILAKAVDRGLVDRERVLSDEEIHQLIFQPGFSTAESVTDLSGRGVGMDVVRRAVESLRGRIEIHSEPGRGTRFSICLPLTLAITDGMLVRVGGERYIVPTMKIHLSFRPEESDLWSVSGRGEMVMLHGQLIPIIRLHRLFRFEGTDTEPTRGILVVVGEGSRKTALLVDELLGQQQFVVKALSGAVAGAPGVAGGAILGDGGVGLILDPDEVIALGRQAGGARDLDRQSVA